MKMNRLTKDKSTKNDKMGKAVFIIPVVAIAIILIACIVVTATAGLGKNDQSKSDKTKQDISNVDNSNVGNSNADKTNHDNSESKKANRSTSGAMAKLEEVKDSNLADSEADSNAGSADDTSDEHNGTGSDDGSVGGKFKENSSGNNGSSSVASGGQSGNTKSSGSTASSGKNSGNSSGSNGNNSLSQGDSTANEPAKSEQPKNEYVAPGWIYYGSKAGNGMTGEQKAYLDSVIKQWTSGSISDSELADMLDKKVDDEWGISISSMGLSQGDRCIYSSRNDIPDYGVAVAESYGIYNFTGLYTKGEYDEYGYLICYMWGVGIF